MTTTTTTPADMLLPGDTVRLIPGGDAYEVRYVGPFTASIHAGAQPGEVCLILKPLPYAAGDAYAEILTPATRPVEVVG